MSNTRARLRRDARAAAARDVHPDQNPGIGRRISRAKARFDQGEMLRRGLLMTLRRRERMIHDQARFEGTRSLLAQVQRLSADRLRRERDEVGS